MNRRPKLAIAVPPTVSPAEAAAVVAALERFMRDTAPSPVATAADKLSPWTRTAVLEAIGAPSRPGPWGDPNPWR